MIWVSWARMVGFDVTLDQNREFAFSSKSCTVFDRALLVLITTSLFWNMLEVSLGIIASCLHTLRGLAKNKSVDLLVNSIREKVSIRSGGIWNKSDDAIELTDLDKVDTRQEAEFITVAGYHNV
jgi:hypothetical protein